MLEPRNEPQKAELERLEPSEESYRVASESQNLQESQSDSVDARTFGEQESLSTQILI